MPAADLVLSGGGVKGAALLGAVMGFMEHDDPYTFRRIAGTSAGAIVGCFLAAGVDTATIQDLVVGKDFRDFEDRDLLGRTFGAVGTALDVLLHEGLYFGDALHSWVADTLAAQGVRTWADLRRGGDELPLRERYALVVVVSDVSRGRELRLPWDYASQLGVDPDTQLVADAVRASASIPFFFRPARVAAAKDRTDGFGYVTCVDGGLLSGYPIDLFDELNAAPEPTLRAAGRVPTIGVKLSAREQAATARWVDNSNPVELAYQMVRTLLDARDQAHVDDPYYAGRTAFVDTTGFAGTDFHLSQAQKRELFARGHAAAEKFLAGWDAQRWSAANPMRRPRRPAGTG